MSVQKAARAGLWSTLDIALRQTVQFGVSIALARLLMPEDFGIIALLTFFSTLAAVFLQTGLTMAIVQRQHTTAAEESAVFWCNLALSCTFGAAMVAAGPAIARFYGHPVLAPLMVMPAAQVVVSALGSVQTALLTRALDFASLAKAGVVSTLIGGAVGVAAAVYEFGVWALAIQVTLAAGLNSLILWWASPWRPSLRWRISDLRRLFGFGAWFTLSGILEVLYTQGFALLIGKFYGARDLGLYNRALSTQQLPTGILSSIIGRIALPLFAGRADEPPALRRGLKMALRLVMVINLPVMVGVAIVPDLLVVVLFGPKWLPAAPILAIVAWVGATFPIHVLNLQLILGQGRSRTYFNIELAKKIGGIAVLTAGSFFGIFGLAIAQLIFSIVALWINIDPVRRTIGYGVLAQLNDLREIILASAAMAALVLGLRALVDLPPLAEIVLLASAGAASYAMIGFLFRMRSFLEALDIAKVLLRRRSADAVLDV